MVLSMVGLEIVQTSGRKHELFSEANSKSSRRSSKKGRKGNALAIGADEGRGKLR